MIIGRSLDALVTVKVVETEDALWHMIITY